MRSVALRSNSPERMCESLYRRHAKDVYRYTLGLLDRPADAEDATQTTFLNAYRALERGERPRNTGTWLHAIALN
ncbi:MAG TPA: sigma factor, partial [Solirubrobacteraceae bacterium]|nr:sigma factor [Solirubrobacteraceae bacterium]